MMVSEGWTAVRSSSPVLVSLPWWGTLRTSAATGGAAGDNGLFYIDWDVTCEGLTEKTSQLGSFA